MPSSATSISRATARSSSFTTSRWIARRTRPGRLTALTAAELARLDAGFRFQPEQDYPYRGRGCGVPRLAELLGRYPSMPVVIEVKGEQPEVADRMLEVVGEADAMDRVMIGGFSDAVLKTVRRRRPELITSASGAEAQSGADAVVSVPVAEANRLPAVPDAGAPARETHAAPAVRPRRAPCRHPRSGLGRRRARPRCGRSSTGA